MSVRKARPEEIKNIRPSTNKKKKKFDDIIDYVDQESKFIYEFKSDFEYGDPDRFGVKLRKPYKLFDYQRTILNRCIKILLQCKNFSIWEDFHRRYGLLWDIEMGLGKTLMSLYLVLLTLKEQRRLGKKSIFIAPIAILNQVANEVEKFFGDQIRVCLFHSSNPEWHQLIKSDKNPFDNVDLIITNHHALAFAYAQEKEKKNDDFATNVRTYRQALYHGKYQWAILDESHIIRNSNTIFKAFMNLDTRRAICMSGTVTYHSQKDIFNQLEAIGGYKIPARSRRPHVIEDLGFASVIEVWKKKDLIQHFKSLPPRHVERVSFEMSPPQKLYYKSTQQTMIESEHEMLFNELSGFELKRITTAPHLITELSKIYLEDKVNLVSNYYKTAVVHKFKKGIDMPLIPLAQPKTKSKVQRWLNDRFGTAGTKAPKMKLFVHMIKRILDNHPDQKVIIFDEHTAPLFLAHDALAEQMPEVAQHSLFYMGFVSSTYRHQVLQAFNNDPKKRLLFITLGTGNTGLNLVSANFLLFLSPCYVFGSHLQAEARIYRTGQTKPVNIYYICGKNSIETIILKTCHEHFKDAKLITKIAKKKKIRDAHDLWKITPEDMETLDAP